MVRFLLTVAIFCALGAAVLGFANRIKLLQLNQDLRVTESARDDAHRKLDDGQHKLDELQKRLKQTEDRLSTQERLTQQERDSRNGELNAARAKLNQLTEQLTARDSENKALTAAITEAGRNLEQKQRAEEDRQALAKRLIETEDELNQYRIAESKKSGDTADLQGSVLSINRDAKAVTVSVGKKKKGPKLNSISYNELVFIKSPAIDKRSRFTVEIEKTGSLRTHLNRSMAARHNRIIE
jgi:hypothetical protein